MAAYYNEIEPFAAAWLRSLIAARLIPDGEVDERSILDVGPGDLRPFRQCHFFAGIGGWPHALDLAGWDRDREVWTGSCPCQPLSSAGQRKGHADERHLWPAFYRLIAECRPTKVFGEQVASKDGREWLAGVRADLEALGYAVGAADLSAACVGAPHIRQRLFWVAQSGRAGSGDHARAAGDERRRAVDAGTARLRPGDGATVRDGIGAASGNGWVADAARVGRNGAPHAGRGRQEGQPQRTLWGEPERSGSDGGLGDANGTRLPLPKRAERSGEGARDQGAAASEPGVSFWASAVWLPCLDGKARRVEPTIQPLAHGIRNRVGLLRGSGNAIVPQVAAEFIAAVMELA